MIKKALVFTIALMLVGCNQSKGKLVITNKNTTSNPDTQEATEAQSTPSDIPEASPGKLTATLKDTLPSEYQGKTELYFQTAVASSALVQSDTSIYNGAECAVDGDVITSWQEGADGDGIGETLTIGFLNPQRVNYLELNAGNWRNTELWDRNLRPKQIEIIVNGESVDVELENTQTRQYVVFEEPVDTVAFAIKIIDIYPGAEGESDVCISEIKAFGDAIAANERTIVDTQPKAAAETASTDVNNTAADSGNNTLTYDENGIPDWYKTRTYWKRSDGQYVCKLTYAAEGNMTFDFNDGVSLSTESSNYETQGDGSLYYGIKKGWSVAYNPNEDSLLVACNPAYTQSRNQGYYYPITQEEYDRIA